MYVYLLVRQLPFIAKVQKILCRVQNVQASKRKPCTKVLRDLNFMQRRGRGREAPL